MDAIMHDICRKQNLPENIDRLAAQRHLYSLAKRVSHFIFVVCIVLPVVLAIIKLLYPGIEWYAKMVVVFSFLATIAKNILGDVKKSRQNLAARIQQLFDCDLYNMVWNDALCGNRPLPEEIFRYKEGVQREKLYNWYELEIESLIHENAVLVCMRTNVVYDQGIRRYYQHLCSGIAIVAALFVFSSGLIVDISFWNLFLYGIVPLMPVVSWYVDVKNQYRKNMAALDKLHVLIKNGLEKAEEKKVVTSQELMTIQNFIFIHRNTSYTIPDFIYNMKRNESEKATAYSVQQICEKLK